MNIFREKADSPDLKYAIELIDLKKEFDGNFITKGVDLKIPRGKMTCIIGKSGEGKSVLLKQIIGLIQPTSGEILINGVNTSHRTDERIHKELHKCGYVFQFAALLDSLNIFENIAITLLEHGMSKHDALAIVKEKLDLVHLSAQTLYKYPSELSGGMRKRVGLARTLVTNPEIILYDEPTTGLDPITTSVIHRLMHDMQKQLNITSVVITHDVDIFNYADYVALLYEGRIHHFGSAKDIWNETNPFIYQFIRGLPEGPMQTEMSSASEQ